MYKQDDIVVETVAEKTEQEMRNEAEFITCIDIPEGQQPIKSAIKRKRDIFRFSGEKPTAINLEHVTQIGIEGKRLTFNFYSTAMFVDLADDESALNAFEQILRVWSADE